MGKISILSSHTVFVALTALAVSGCGKSVDRDGSLNSAQQMPVHPSTLTGGSCDIVGVPAAKEVLSFGDISESQGKYELVSFQAVGMKSIYSGSTSRDGIAAIEGKSTAAGIEVNVVCEDMDQMPTDTLAFSVTAPAGVSATDGTIASNLTAQYTAYGKEVTDPSGRRPVSTPSSPVAAAAECSAVNSSLGGDHCSGKTRYFKLDDHSIGVLHIVESRDASGAVVTGKVYSVYALNGGPSTGPVTQPGNNGNNGPGQGKGKKNGKKTGNKKPAKKPAKKPNDGNNNNGNNNGDNDGNNGKPTKGPGQGPGQGPSENSNGVTVVYRPGPRVVYGGPTLPGTLGNGDEANEPNEPSNGQPEESTEQVTRYKLKVKAKVSASGATKLKVKEKKTTVDEDGNTTDSKVKEKEKTSADGSSKTKIKVKSKRKKPDEDSDESVPTS